MAPAKKATGAKSAKKTASKGANSAKKASASSGKDAEEKGVTSGTKKSAAGKKKATSKIGSSRADRSTGAKATKAADKKSAKTSSLKKATAKKAVSKNTTASKKSVPEGKASSSSTAKTDASGTDVPTIPADAAYLLDQEWLDTQRTALNEHRAKYTHSADRLAAEAAALMADREPGDVQFDEESGEGDTIAVERDRDLALSAAARQAVTDIDAALARLDAGTYGICLVSGDPIPRERLEAIPEASVCVQYKTSMF